MIPNGYYRRTLESLYAAFARRDANTIRSLISPEIVIEQTSALPWGGNYSGHAGLQEFFDALLSHIDSSVHIERILEAGEHVVAIGRTKGTVRANGKSFDVPVVHVWRVQDGKLTAFHPYIENAQMLEALNG